MTGSIPQEFIKEIIDLSNVVEIIEGYLPLKKKGKDHWGQCPFCDDGKNPSFSVSSLKQFYYCFKCRSTGNVIGFLQEFEGLSFVESVEALASKAGVEIPYQNLTGVREDREPIFNILRSASDFFEDFLSQESSSKHVQKYIKVRLTEISNQDSKLSFTAPGQDLDFSKFGEIEIQPLM